MAATLATVGKAMSYEPNRIDPTSLNREKIARELFPKLDRMMNHAVKLGPVTDDGLSLPSQPQDIVPMVIENSGRVERAFDIFSLLLRERIVFLGTPIDDMVANLIVAQLLFLAREDPDKDINLYIHSPGGSITAGLAMYDTFHLIPCDVSTICVGLAASMGTILLSSGAKGKRYALPNATVHMHQPISGVRGQASDLEIHAREVLRLRTLLNNVLVDNTGQPLDRIEHDTDRDYFMAAKDAVAYGLIDEVLVGARKKD